MCVDGCTRVTVMASSSDVVKKIMRLKLQLMDTLESATVDTLCIPFHRVFMVCIHNCTGNTIDTGNTGVLLNHVAYLR